MSGSDRHGKQSGAKEKIYYKRCILCPDRGTCMGRMQISGFTDDAVYHCFSGSGSDPGTGKEVQGIKKAEKAFVYCFLCCILRAFAFAGSLGQSEVSGRSGKSDTAGSAFL